MNKEENITIQNEIKSITDYVVEIKEFKFYTWDEKLQMLKDFIDTYIKRPNDKSINKFEKLLAYWLDSQNDNFKK